MACHLVGCMTKYNCGEIKEPIPGTNLAPFVTIGFEDENGSVITVGNNSDPSNGNHAVIKSFQYGNSNGAGVVIEIMDEEGSDFQKFMDKLNKCISRASDDYKMRVQWGWIDRACGSANGTIVSQSDVYYFLPIHIEATFSEGKIKFQVTGSSLLELVFETRPAEVYGSDDHKITVKEAIKEMFANRKPNIASIQYLRINSQGALVEWEFDSEPKSKWEVLRQNKLSTALMWLEPFKTDRGKGIVPIWDPKVPGGNLIFFEDPKAACNEAVDWCTRSIGTYVINGGSCSPVISFTPTAKWPYGPVGKAGGVVPVTGGETGEIEGREGCNIGEEDTGTQTATPVSIQAAEHYGFKKSDQQMQKAQAAHEMANVRNHSMEAELRIQGDPTLAGPDRIFGRVASIIVISPFHLRGNSSCGDWLAYPGCHPVYSNKAWIIAGTDHHVKEGSYVTTLKIALNSPGADINPNEPFGGENSGGFVPKEPCAN